MLYNKNMKKIDIFSSKFIWTTTIILLFIFTIIYESQALTRLSSANYGSDGGDYLSAVLTHGIPHPTGYPLYLLLSDVIQALPVNNPIWRQSQLSIFPALLCVLLIIKIIWASQSENSSKKFNIYSGWVGGLLLCLSPLFWSQAIIVEVYALNVLFLVLWIYWLWLVEKYRKQGFSPDALRRIILLAGINGLGLGNHTTILLIYPVLFITLWLSFRSSMPIKSIAYCILGMFSGVILYSILPIRSIQNPPINWGAPDNIDGLFWVISGGDYRSNVFGILPGEYPNRIASFFKYLIDNFSVILIPVGIAGVMNHRIPKLFRLVTIYIFIVYAVFAIGYKTNDSLAYVIPSMIVFVLWISWGIPILAEYNWNRKPIGRAFLAIAIIIFIIKASMIYPVYKNPEPDLTNYAEEQLKKAEKGSVILTRNDGETFALWYYHFGLGYRKDIKVISLGLLQYDWYQDQLLHTYQDFDSEKLQEIIIRNGIQINN